MGERSEHVPRVVYETLKEWKLLNSLQQIKIVANAYGRSNYIMIWKGAWSSSREDLTNQPISRQTYGRGQWRQNCVRSPRAGSTFRIRSWSYKE